MDYSGFSFAEKKTLKEKEEKNYPGALKHVQDKLGAEWKFEVDWPIIQTNCPAGDRQYIAGFIYDRYVAKLGDEVSKWTDLAEAVNDRVKGKKLVITLDTSGKDYDRYDIRLDDKAITVAIQHTKLGYDYPYSERHTMTAEVEKLV